MVVGEGEEGRAFLAEFKICANRPLLQPHPTTPCPYPCNVVRDHYPLYNEYSNGFCCQKHADNCLILTDFCAVFGQPAALDPLNRFMRNKCA